MTQLQPSQMMASNLIGTTVVGANNEPIGDVNDVILDRNGQAMAVVIGVGGFLGIGEKDVAVPFSELEFASAPMTAAASGRATSGAGQQNMAANGNNVSATGSTASTATGGTASDSNANAAQADRNGGVPKRIVLRMAKDELQAAPSFRSGPDRDRDSSESGAAGGANAPAASQQ